MTYEENVRAILESNFAGFKEEVIDTACKAICGLRTYGEWIPVEERLPEKSGLYAICVKRYGKLAIELSRHIEGELWCADNAIAWMKLPEPCKKEEIQKTYSTKLIPIGFSQHDCESHYKCPFCGEGYGSWSIPIGKPFKCKCGEYVWTD